MSADEFLALLGSVFISAVIWGRWLWLRIQLGRFSPATASENVILAFSMATSAAALFALLANYASHDVRDSVVYMGFYLVMGLAVAGLGLVALGWLELSLRDDVIERRNPAAALALAGAVPGLTLAYAGSNIGDGPGWWVVVFCSGLSVGGLLLGWLLLDGITHLGESIVVERNRAAAVRAGSWFVATGAILGRAAAGDWLGAGNALKDFGRIGLSAAGLLAVAVALEIWFRRHPGRPDGSVVSRGLAPGLVLLCLSLLCLHHYGLW